MYSSLKNNRACVTFILAVIISANCKAQDTETVEFYFKLFDNQGNSVIYKTFCEEYQMLGELDRRDQTSCNNYNL